MTEVGPFLTAALRKLPWRSGTFWHGSGTTGLSVSVRKTLHLV